MTQLTPQDVQRYLLRLCQPDFFGKVEFSIHAGAIIHCRVERALKPNDVLSGPPLS